MEKLKAIIFDMDGTIADSAEIGLKAVNSLADKYSYDPVIDSPEIRDLSPTEFIRSHLKLGGIRFLLWFREVKHIFTKHVDKIKIFPDIKETIQGIKDMGLEVGLVTSNSKENTIQILRNNDLLDLFNFIYTGASLFSKARTIKKMLKQEKLSVFNTIYIGDEIRDIVACNKVGIPIISVTWGANSAKVLKEHKADYYAWKPDDIIDILKKI